MTIQRLAAILPGWAGLALDVLESVPALCVKVSRFLVMVQTLGHIKTARPAQVSPVEVIPLKIHAIDIFSKVLSSTQT